MYTYSHICVHICTHIALDLQGGGERKVYFFSSSFFKNIYLFVGLTFSLWWIFLAVHGLFLVAESGGYSSWGCVGFSLPWLLPLQSTGSRCTRFTSCSSWALGSWAVLWSVGLGVLQHVGSSPTKDQTGVPCIASWILNHWTTRETSVSLVVKKA